jgi:glutaredoxin
MLVDLHRWFAGTPRHNRQVILYTRQGCHLCEDVWAILEETQRQKPFALQKVDVDTDPELARRYGLEVPVVVIDGRMRFRGRINAVLLRRALR